jgi:hypothetical protein
MKLALLKYDYNFPTYNIGDYIQSLAAKQYLQDEVILVNREGLKDYEGEDIKLIMNGWFLHNLEQWPPSDKIHPLFISFHLSPHAKVLLDDCKNVQYFKKYEPIGCRDFYTMEVFRNKGIKTYFSGCLTLTLGQKYKREYIGNEILFVDVLPNMLDLEKLKLKFINIIKNVEILKMIKLIYHLKNNIKIILARHKIIQNLFSKKILSVKQDLNHDLNSKDTNEERFDKADLLLKRYANAKMVFTSKIHCALPCLAFGTPVVFIKGPDVNSEFDTSRFDGLLDYLNVIEINSQNNISCNYSHKFKKIDSSFIPPSNKDIRTLVENLNFYVKEFIHFK